MDQTTFADSLGARLIWAARTAVTFHLEMDESQKFDQKAAIGGTDQLPETMNDRWRETTNDER